PEPSKSLTPLYSGGLCDAEMTAPRSRASSATAGVGRMPASTAVPPAEATPDAKARSRSRPEARVFLPTKTAPLPHHSVAARPSRSTSSGVRSCPTTPRTPSVPKYRRATVSADPLIGPRTVHGWPQGWRDRSDPGQGLTFSPLRRFARLLEPGL